MKKLLFKSIYVALAVGSMLGMQSCGRVVDNPRLEVEQVGFTTDIVAPGAPAAAPTMAGAEISKTKFVSGDKMGLWVVPFKVTGDGAGVSDVRTDLRSIGNYSDNVLHTHNGTSFVASTAIFYPTSISKVDLYAVSPYDAKMSDKTANSITDPKAFEFAIAQNQSIANGTAVLSSDIMTAHFSGAKQGANGNLSFYHRLSRVLIKFTLSPKYKDQTINKIKSVEMCNVKLKSKINLTDVTASPSAVVTSNEKVNVATYAAIVPDASKIDGDYVYEAIITPGTAYAKDEVIVKVVLEVATIGDVEFVCKAKDAVTIAHQKQTTISISLTDQSAISFGKVDINGWGTPIVLNPSTTKLSNMIIACQDGGQAINKTAVKAKLTIQGEVIAATANYDDAKSCYRLQYDHKDRFGGYLTAIEMTDALDQKIFTAATLPSTGLQIKGDPTSDTYSTVIGTMSFKVGGSVELK